MFDVMPASLLPGEAASSLGAGTDHRLITLFRRLSLASIAAILLSVGYGLYWTYSRQIVSEAERVATVLGQMIIEQERSVLLAPDVVGRERLAVAPAEFAGLDERVRSHLRLFRIYKVNMFSVDKRVVYSTDRSSIGKAESGNPRLARALNSGLVVSELVSKDRVLTLAGEQRHDVGVVETYVPIEAGGAIIGILELYADVTSMRDDLRRALSLAVAALSLVLVVVFTGLYVLMKNAQTRLTKARTQLEIVLEDCGIFAWEIDLRTHRAWLSTAWAAVLGARAGETQTMMSELEQLVHPGDLEKSAAAAVATLKGETARYACDLRVRAKNGDWKWLLCHGRVTERDASGRALKMSGASADITERKQAEEALRARDTRYRKVIETTTDGFWIVDTAGRLVEANASYARQSGYCRDELAGMHVNDLDALEGPEQTAARIEKAMRHGGDLFETAHRRKNGSLWPVEISAAYVGNEGGYFCVFLRNITERKLAEDALTLKLEQQRLATAAANVYPWVWDIASDELTWIVPPEPLLGPRPPSGAYPEFRDLVHPDDRERFLAGTRAAMRSLSAAQRDCPYESEYRIVRTDGAARWMHARGRVEADAAGVALRFVGVTADVHERKLAEEVLAQAGDQLRLIFESVPAAIGFVDRAERVVAVNRRWETLFEMQRADVVGRAVREAIGEQHYAQAQPHVARALAGEASRFERTVRPHSGSARVQQVQYEPYIDAGGAVQGFFGLISDVTEMKQVQEALRELSEDLQARVAERTVALERVNRELAATVKELEAFSYSVSHDLKAPLRAIGGFSRMVLEDEGPNLSLKGRRDLAVIERNAVKMGELVDDLLQVARVARAELRRERLDMHALAGAIAGELCERYPLARVEIGALPAAEGDATLLRQVLTNLMDNAFKYSAPAEAPRVELGWSEASGAWYVRDNGVGFDMQYAGRLFGMFQRLHSERDFHGTGVGLAIVKRIVERHGGRVWAVSAPGGGASFYFTLGELPAAAVK